MKRLSNSKNALDLDDRGNVMTYDPKDNPNYLPDTPYAFGFWQGREIEAYESKTYGVVIFYKDNNEEAEVEPEQISQIFDCLIPIEKRKLRTTGSVISLNELNILLDNQISVNDAYIQQAVNNKSYDKASAVTEQNEGLIKARLLANSGACHVLETDMLT